MTRTELENVVISIAAKSLKLEEASLNLDKEWVKDLSARSAHFMKIMALTKMKTDITVTPNELASCVTVRDLVDLIESKQ